MDLAQFKAENPQYKNIQDATLAQALYNRYYANSGLSWGDFTKAIHYTPPLTLASQPPAHKSFDPYQWEGNIAVLTPMGATAAGSRIGYKASQILEDTAAGLAEDVPGSLINIGVGVTSFADYLADFAKAVVAGKAAPPVADLDAAIAAGEYHAKSPEAQAFNAELGRLLSPVAKPIAAIGGGVLHAVEAPGRAMSSLVAKELKKHGHPVAAEDVQTASDLGEKIAPAALMAIATTGNPITRFLGETVSPPLRAGENFLGKKAATYARRVGHAVTPAIASPEELAAAKQAQKLLYGAMGRAYLRDHDAAQILQHDFLELSPDDHLAITKYLSDKTATWPLTPKQMAFVTQHLMPIRLESGQEAGYLHRVSLEHPGFESEAMGLKPEEEALGEKGVVIRGAKALGRAVRASVSPRFRSMRRLSKTMDAANPRSFFKLVPENARREGENDVDYAIRLEKEGVTGGKIPLIGYFENADKEFPISEPGVERYPSPAHQYDVRVFGHAGQGESEGWGLHPLRNLGGPDQVIYHEAPGANVGDLTRYRVQAATHDEITAATGHRYVTDPVYTTVRAWHQAMTAKETGEVLDNIKTVLKPYLTDAAHAPEGWEPINSPHFKGAENASVFAPPSIKHVLEAFLGEKSPRWVSTVRSISHSVLNASFAIPVWHDLNMIQMALTEKLPRLLEPEGWKYYKEAWDEVTHVKGLYRQQVAAGEPYWNPAIFPQTLQHISTHLLGELNTERGASLLEKVGIPVDEIKGALHWYSKNVMHNVGTLSDTLVLAAIKQRMALYRISAEQAAKDVFRQMPTYRIEPTSRVLHIMQRSNLFWFLPYHAARFSILYNRLKRAASLDPEAWTQLAGTAFMAMVAYPAIDRAIQKSTGNDKAHVERFGDVRIAADLIGAVDRDEPAARLLGDMITQNGALYSPQAMVESGYQTRGKGGKYGTLGQQALAGLEQLPVYPLQNALRNRGSIDDAILSQLGVWIPPDKRRHHADPFQSGGTGSKSPFQSNPGAADPFQSPDH